MGMEPQKESYFLIGFSDGEIQVNIENQFEASMFYLRSTGVHLVNDNLMEILIMVDALKRQVQNLSMVMPYYGYARQTVRPVLVNHYFKSSSKYARNC